MRGGILIGLTLLALSACTSPDQTRVTPQQGRDLHDFINASPTKP
ncbi:hypothetical protein SAMN07250955_10786 [Arboricoccus pini]|uniref:Uncharacterized protein n=1 Tax=Arboricoccus pini TaxID=1963835 RepID=A0A212RCM9_9PROT|nr:hypothetical protein [Arboricoccus pini]SNB69969.1 hypothetical protein SAMN07250955_10786 [Arboricoccus pini]